MPGILKGGFGIARPEVAGDPTLGESSRNVRKIWGTAKETGRSKGDAYFNAKPEPPKISRHGCRQWRSSPRSWSPAAQIRGLVDNERGEGWTREEMEGSLRCIGFIDSQRETAEGSVGTCRSHISRSLSPTVDTVVPSHHPCLDIPATPLILTSLS